MNFLENVTKLGEELNEIFKDFDHDFTFKRQGYARCSKDGKWATIFVRNKDDVQVGKITLENRNGEAGIYFYKSYRKFHYEFEMGDLIWIALVYYFQDNITFSKQQMLELIPRAEQRRTGIINKNQQWRIENPKFKIINGKKKQVKRKKLQGYNLRMLMHKIIREEVLEEVLV